MAGHGDPRISVTRDELLADFRTVFFGKIQIAERTMKIHPRPEHVGIDDKNFLTLRTGNLYRLTHDSPLNLILSATSSGNTIETQRL
jgi:hypothetical protein